MSLVTNFYKAIRQHFKADPGGPFYTGVAGRFSYGEAAAGSPHPYAVYHGMPGRPEDTGCEAIDDLSFQINIYSDAKSATEAMALTDLCLDLFDDAVVPVAGGREITLKREMVTPPWKNGDQWVASIEFSTLLQEG